MSAISEFALPSDPEDLKKIRTRLEEIQAQRTMIADRQAGIKDTLASLKDMYDMPASLANKLVKALEDDKYVEMTEEASVFELVRESVLGDGGLPDDRDVA